MLDLDDPAEDGDQNMSEDCLTVNVWTPRADTKARPVMVFIHGGALEEGSAEDSCYDGAYLAERGDVVVVSLQYRLGVFGFLELGEVGGTRFADSGNLGLLDQIEALRWVQQNAVRFGAIRAMSPSSANRRAGQVFTGCSQYQRPEIYFKRRSSKVAIPASFYPKKKQLTLAQSSWRLRTSPRSRNSKGSASRICCGRNRNYSNKGYGLATFAWLRTVGRLIGHRSKPSPRILA